jgi:hypothetical protein
MQDTTDTTVTISQFFFSPYSEWLWTMLQFMIITISLIFIGIQVRHQRNSNILSTLNNFYLKWNTDEMINCRMHICNDYLSKKEITINNPEYTVLSFFEEMGVYLKKNVVDISSIWDLYSYCIEHYWPVLKPRIEEVRNRENDRTLFIKFEYLYNEITKYTKSQKVKFTKTDEEIRRFVNFELNKINKSTTDNIATDKTKTRTCKKH